MKINLTTNMLSATPIRPLFKGNSNRAECLCPCCQSGNCDTEIKPETRKVDNKGLSDDKFEREQAEKQKAMLATLIMFLE